MTKESYYEKNKQRIQEYERARYIRQKDQFKLRSKKASVRGRLSYEMLSKPKKLEVDREIEKIFGELTWRKQNISILFKTWIDRV